MDPTFGPSFNQNLDAGVILGDHVGNISGSSFEPENETLRSKFRFHCWSQFAVPGFHFWFQFWAHFWYPKLEPKIVRLIVFTLDGSKNGACFWNQKWTQNWHQKLKPRAQIWAISGPKTAQKLEPKMAPRHRKKRKLSAPQHRDLGNQN